MFIAGPLGQRANLQYKTEFKALLGQPLIAVMGSEQAKYTADL